MQLLLALSGLAIIIAVVLSRTIGRSGRYYLKLLPAIFSVLVGLGLIGLSCMINIKPDCIGIVKSNGIIQSDVLNSGWNVVSPLAEVIQLDNKVQNDTIYRTTASENSINNDTLSGYTSDGKEVKMALVVTYLINPNNAALLYKEAGLEFKQNIVQPLSHNLLLRDTKSFDAKSLSTVNWDVFRAQLNTDFKGEFRKHGLELAKITVRRFDDGDALVVKSEIVKPQISIMADTVVKDKKPVAKAIEHKKIISKPTPPPVKPHVSLPINSVVKSDIAAPKKAVAKIRKTVKGKTNSAYVDTMYHHALKQEMAVKHHTDTIYHSTVAPKIESVAVVDTTPPAPPVAQNPTPPVTTVPEVTPPPVVSTSPALPVFVEEGSQSMDAATYASMKEYLKTQATDDKKLEALRGVSKINAFTSAQVAEISSTLTSPEAKLEFAEMAYARTVDRRNYRMVAGSFSKKSKKSLDNYIINLMAAKNSGAAMPSLAAAGSSAAQAVPASIPAAAGGPSSPATDVVANDNNTSSAASAPKYVVPADCQVIDDERYLALRRRIVSDNTKDENQEFLKSTIENNCFTADQVKSMLKLVHNKKTKLEMAKLAYIRTVDRNKYSIIANTFSKRQRKALDKYIIRMMAVTIASKPETVPIAKDEANQIIDEQKIGKPIDGLLLKSLEEFTKEHFSDASKMVVLSKILSTNYFTSAQVANITKLFSTADAKLRFAEMAYTRTVDKGTYNLVIASLDNNSQKQLEEYIIGLFASK